MCLVPLLQQYSIFYSILLAQNYPFVDPAYSQNFKYDGVALEPIKMSHNFPTILHHLVYSLYL